MAYDFLGITNKVLTSFNEVNLSSSNFATITGFHADVKNSVNKAIRDIYTDEETQWPFAWTEYSFTTLTDGTQIYTPDANANQINWDSFYVDADSLLEQPYQKLDQMAWQVYLDEYRINDKAATTIDQYDTPYRVVRRPNNTILISPKADKAYTVKYEAYSYPTALEDYDDVPAIPETYEQVILDGAEYYANLFRDNYELASACEQRFQDGIHQMRRSLISNPTHLTFYGN